MKIASAHFHIPRKYRAKFHNNPMDSLGIANNIFWTYGLTNRWKDKGNLINMPCFNELAGHSNPYKVFMMLCIDIQI